MFLLWYIYKQEVKILGNYVPLSQSPKVLFINSNHLKGKPQRELLGNTQYHIWGEKNPAVSHIYDYLKIWYFFHVKKKKMPTFYLVQATNNYLFDHRINKIYQTQYLVQILYSLTIMITYDLELQVYNFISSTYQYSILYLMTMICHFQSL